MKYRLGIDLGTNSLGWAAIQLSEALEPRQLVDMGARIFSDARNPKDKSSNAAQRREPRAARRNRDRKLSRKQAMLHSLLEFGLFPSDPAEQKELEALDPWILRYRALHEKLEPYEIGRAFFHLQQRRGFKSNRKTDGVEAGAMYDAIGKARWMMDKEGAKTLGELFGRGRFEQQQINDVALKGAGEPMPQARVKARAEGSKMAYDYYPDRAMILDEFDQIWDAQAPYYPALLNEKAYSAVRHVLEFQRPLKAQKAGKCTFLPEEPRAPKALPSAQYARILQEVNNLKLRATTKAAASLTTEQRNVLIDFLMNPSSKGGKRTFKSIRKKLSLPESQQFSHESRKRDHLVGDLTAAKLMQEDAWGGDWLNLDREVQDSIVIKLLEVEEEGELVNWLVSEYGMDKERAKRVSRTRLPDAHGKLSKAALDRIIPHLEEGVRYDKAASQEFLDHRAIGDGVIYDDSLPYYGEVLNRHTAFEKDNPKNAEEQYGRVANPTVHVALNQLQKVINDLIKRWGPPTQIVLELARELPLSDRGLKDLEKRQDNNQKANEERDQWLESQGFVPSYQNRLKLRLYEEALESFDGVAVCVFTGKTISKTEVFTEEIEIEHILPLSKTLDDSITNKVLSRREANRVKKNRSPYEAFGSNPGDYNWESIYNFAAQLPSSKSWRFDPDAMEQWEERGDFLARQLNDTRYIARLGKTFVEALYGGQGSIGQERQVWVVPGQLTSDLRYFAGLNDLIGLTGGNRKDRTDHRHHAVDALVVALTDQAMVKRAADLAKKEDMAEHYEIMKAMAEPLKRYRKSAEDRLSKLVVSHKPDHGFQDAMHNDTAYGLTADKDHKGNVLLVTRKPLESLSKPADLDKIRDEKLRHEFSEATMGLTGKDFTEALLQAGKDMFPPVYSVRIIEPMKESSFVTIKHGDGDKKAYKGDSNYCYDIWMGDKGKWTGEVVTTFQAYQMAQTNPKWWRKPEGLNGQPLILRIRKGDMLEIDGPMGRRQVVVYKFTAGAINMAEHFEANASQRVRAKDLPAIQMAPGSLQKANAVRIGVSPSGRIKRYKQ